MNDDVEAQVRRQAEVDRQIEEKIARYVRRSRAMTAAGIALVAGIIIVLTWSGLRQLSVPELDADDHFSKALAHEQQGELRAATAELKRVLQLNSENAEARFRLGRIHVEQGEGKAGEKEIRHARLLGFSDENMTALLLRSLLLQRRYTEVLVETISLTSDAGREAILALEGEAQLGLKQLDKARETYEGLLAANPASRLASIGLVRVHIGELELDRSLEQIGRVRANAPDDPEALLLEGIANLHLGRPDVARESLEAPALAGHPEAEIAIAQSYLGQGNTAAARTHLDAATKVAGETSAVLYLEAVADIQDGDLQTARNTLRELLKTDPTQLDGWYLMAWLNVDQEEYRQAESSLVRLLEASPTDLAASKLLASVHLELGQADEALRVLAPLEGVAQADGQWLALMARGHMLKGDTDQVQVFLDRAAALPGDDEQGDADPSHFTDSWRLERCRVLVNFCEHYPYTRECLSTSSPENLRGDFSGAPSRN